MRYIIILAFLFITLPAFPQVEPLPLPDPSPKAEISQRVGITDITVSYHRPYVKGRTVWGQLVPYNEVWRAGANENTTISFTSPVTVGGKELPAGTYGLHTIPTEKEWTIIFSNNATSWGSFFYNEKEDALRFTVTPASSEHHEMLTYEFNDVNDSSAMLSLKWEKLSVPIAIGVNTKQVVIDNARNVHLRGLPGFFWQGFNQAANYCLMNNMNLDEALTWADKSIGIQENFTNLRTKASILDKLGKGSEAEALRKKSLTIATEADMNNYGYQLMNQKKMKEAIEVFKQNVKSYPNSWNVYDSLAEAYEMNGDKKQAVENYSKALSKTNDPQQKTRITKTLEKLKATM